MKYIVFSIGFVCATAFSVFTLMFYPKLASAMNKSLPESPSAVGRLLLPPGGRFDSRENLIHVRISGFVGILSAAFCAVAIILMAAHDIAR